MVRLGEWNEALKGLFESENYTKLRQFLHSEYLEHTIYPDARDIFNCFKLTPLSSVKAVIIGQDPYHGENQAHGLCFSVKKGIKKPPSLVNIFKELQQDLGIEPPNSGDLTKWAQSGVLLLNASLTVRAACAGSHSGCGWQEFTDRVISIVSEQKNAVVFILWGNYARSKKRLIDTNKHFIIESAHPSPLSAFNGFFGSKPFSRANEFLRSKGTAPIDWNLQ